MDLTSGQKRILKIINLEGYLDDKNALSDLKNEIKILSMIKGDHLVQAYSSFINDNHLCIVMEFLQGGDMR